MKKWKSKADTVVSSSITPEQETEEVRKELRNLRDRIRSFVEDRPRLHTPRDPGDPLVVQLYENKELGVMSGVEGTVIAILKPRLFSEKPLSYLDLFIKRLLLVELEGGREVLVRREDVRVLREIEPEEESDDDESDD